MRRVSSLLLAVAAALVPSASQAGGERMLVLFGAHWCAPCMVEYGRLASLVAAAAPDHVELAWIDRPIQRPSNLPSVSILAPENARRLAYELAGEGYGLPFAALLEESGQHCMLHRGAIAPEHITAMRADRGGDLLSACR